MNDNDAKKPDAAPKVAGKDPLTILAEQRAALEQQESMLRDQLTNPPHPLELPVPEVLELEKTTKQFPRAFCDHHRVWMGNLLQTCSEIGRYAHDIVRLARPDQVADHDKTRRNADSRLQWGVRFELANGCDCL